MPPHRPSRRRRRGEMTAGEWVKHHQRPSEGEGAPAAGAPRSTHRAFLAVSIGGEAVGRLTLDLFGDVAPRTVENYVGLLRTKYNHTRLHRIIPRFMLQGGDYNAPRRSDSFFGGTFADESFALKHSTPGTLSMANYGPNTNQAQFFLTFVPTPHLDGKHVVFGRLEGGFDVLRRMERVGRRSGKPLKEVLIIDCGVHELAGGVADAKSEVRQI